MVAQQLEMKELVPTTDTESRLLSCLSKEASYIDEICHRSGLPIATVCSTLAMLELKWLAKQVGGMNYVRA
jgi:predicted Rossmann fold nucleotide-binding protein DprA/Smf involved in DNA uptake